MLRTHRQPSERQLAQQFAHRALVQLDRKLPRNPQLQIDTALPYHAIPLKLRTLLDPVCHSGLLFG